MAVFAVQYTYTDDAEKVQAVRPEHREYLQELHAAGTLLLAGPLGGTPGGLLIVRAGSEEEALAAVDGDPFVRDGVVIDRSAREWTVSIGELPGA
ncbi:YciI family protein [Brachybacterium sp. GCM10030252]|uniref:YciI family protein n=1 Tax=Brachybacterium sp. GCM10030252 TaxID=3273380 RepID=UPI00360ADDFD